MIDLKKISDYMIEKMSHYNPEADGKIYDDDGYCGDDLWLEIKEFWKKFDEKDFLYLVSCEWANDFDLEGGRSYLLDSNLVKMSYQYMTESLNWSQDDYEKIIWNTVDFSDEILELYMIDEMLAMVQKNTDETVVATDANLAYQEDKVCNCGLKESEHNVRHPFIPKQETLEEAAEKHATNPGMMAYVFPDKKESFIKGAKWQAERMYSEEDMFEFSQWISHNDWVYLPSKNYWVNEEQEELEQKLSSNEILNLWLEQK